MQVEDIQTVVERCFKENDLDACFFVKARIAGPKIQVFIDQDGGISFSVCRRVSRYLEAIFDESQFFGEKYTLEVSSPGIGFPLTLKRQYKNNVGRKIEVKLNDGQKYSGKLIQATGEEIALEFLKTRKEGKKKIKEIKVLNLIYGDISEAKIKVSFK